MRLRRLDLDYFGHFTERRFDFGARDEARSDVHIIYGPNEAGKTTLMEGYLRLLYGFAARNEPYEFKHGRGALRIAGDLEIDGSERRFVRLAKRTGGLLDGAGAPVPETALSGALAGLSAEDYRKLLCLDDKTIESGGDEIAQSRGDIGRLLFSATAGVSGLTEVLETVETEADALYRKRRSASAFAGLARRHGEIAAQIDDSAIDAPRYRRMREHAAEAAAAAEAALSAYRKARAVRDGAKALVEAVPVADELGEIEGELAPLAEYPDATGIDANTLVGMTADRATFASEVVRLERELDGARTTQAGLAPDPWGLALVPRLHDLKGLRDRCAAAAADLPRRQEQLETVRATMAARLSGLGQPPGAPVAPWVLEPDALEALDAAFRRAAAAERDVQQAERELRDAAFDVEEAEGAHRAAEAAQGEGADIATLLARHGAERLTERYTESRAALRQSEGALGDALVALSIGGVHFAELPDLPLSHADAVALKDAFAEAERATHAAREADEEARSVVERLETEIAGREQALGLPSDAEAARLRTQREARWAAHRQTLSGETADAFAEALRADDAAAALRLARADDLGAIRERRLSLAEAQRVASHAAARRTDAERALAATEQRLAELCAAQGLPQRTDAAAFAAWVGRAEVALDASGRLARLRDDTAEVLTAANALRAELAEALACPGAGFEAVLDIARAQALEQSDRARAVAAAAESLERARRGLRKRSHDRDVAKAAADTAGAELDALRSALGGGAGRTLGADALPVLRALREDEVQRDGLARQVAGMAADATAFSEALTPLIADDAACAGMDPVEAYDALSARADRAEKMQAKQTELDAQVARLETGLAEARAGIARIDAATADLARAFSASIPTGSLDALRSAVLAADRAAELRRRRARVERQLLAGLGVPDRAAAEAALSACSAADRAVALDAAEAAYSAAEARHTEAAAAWGEARQALASVTGSAETAALTTRLQTVEMEMEETLLAHLRLRFGLSLAGQALHRFREAHRSTMMETAEAAFSDLTGGAYSGLRAQPAGTGEALVALHAASGAAKHVDGLSKGTRFQLYLALRAAAYAQMVQGGTVLPFFCDDVFETFDEERTRAACGLMRRVGQSGQAIYLTHHRHVVEIAEDVCAGDLRVHRL